MAETEIVYEPGRQDIVVTRVFDAPRDVVFEAITDPGLIPRWWGGERFTTGVDHMDVQPGGAWRFVLHGPDGGEPYAFRGVYHDVVPAERIVSTFEFEPGGPGYLQLIVETFEDADGGTRYRSVALFQSVQDRDGWIPTDMDAGIRASMDLLDTAIQSLR
jgi:uncharacterized protein YndB with AHSA1/START domain